jgi:hypothetical protein
MDWSTLCASVIGRCRAYMQINEDPLRWRPRWINATAVVVSEPSLRFGILCHEDARFRDMLWFSPMFLNAADVPAWLPLVTQEAGHHRADAAMQL